MGQRLPVSVLIIAFNEADRIGRAVASADWADQVLVIDSGSTDETRAVAARGGAQVVQHAWEGYGPQKAFGVGLARNRWVFWLDADEAVSPDLARSLRTLFEAGTPRADAHAAYAMNRRTCYLGRFIRFGGWYPDRKVRLFDRARARFSDALVHEELIVDGPVGRLRGDLLHYSYRDLGHHLRKTQEMARLWAQQQPHRRTAAWEPVIHPAAKALKSYYLRAGFLEGWRGLVLAGIASYSVWLKYQLLRERRADARVDPRADRDR